MDSTHNDGKSVVAERFIRTLKSRVYKYMTSVSKNEYMDKLDCKVNEYSNTYHRTLKMEPVDVKDNSYIGFGKENNGRDSKFQVGDHLGISKYKIIIAERHTPNWSEEIFLISKIKSAVPWTYVITDLNGG